MYSWPLLSGKISWMSSKRRQKSAVFKGFSARCLSSFSRRSVSKSIWAFSSMFPQKYLTTNFWVSSSVNPSVSKQVSKQSRTLLPTSCCAVATIWHFERIGPWMISFMTCNLLVGNSSSPSSTSKIPNPLSRRTDFIRNSFLSFSLPSRGRSWSTISSKRSAHFISRQFSSNNDWNFWNKSFASSLFKAQS